MDHIGRNQKNEENNTAKHIEKAIDFASGRGLKYSDKIYKNKEPELCMKRKNAVFGKGEKITTFKEFMEFDFASTLQRLDVFLREWGEDPQNGWQFFTPIKRLSVYQEFLRKRIDDKKTHDAASCNR